LSVWPSAQSSSRSYKHIGTPRLHYRDVLTVTKPDRLARSTAELLPIEADLSKRGIGLVRTCLVSPISRL
jgi:DNA invertase Pin-like site-specific DNA recombinase